MNKFLNQFLQSNKKVFACLFVIGFLSYAYVLPTPFKTMDDLISIVHNPHLKDFSHIKEIFTSSFFGEKAYYRPMVMMSFLLEYQTFKLNSFFYNLNNVLLHILSSIAVFLILARLSKNRIASFFTSLLFVIHPLQWEAICNIPGRAILLCAFFLLWGFYFYLRSFEEDRNYIFCFLSLLCYAAAMLSKESGIVLIGLVVSHMFFFEDCFKKTTQKSWIKLGAYFILAITYLDIRKSLEINAITHWDSITETITAMTTFLYTSLNYYAAHIILPLELYYDYSSPLLQFGSITFYTVLSFFALVLISLLVKRKSISAVVWFFISWIVINFSTVSQIVPIRSSANYISTADHFVYLPSVGIFFILVIVITRLYLFLKDRIKLNESIAVVAMIGYFLFLFLTTIQQNVYATQQIAMYERSLENNPANNRVRIPLAVAYAYASKFEKAEAHFNRVLETEPYNTQALIGLGKSLSDQERYWDSLQAYEKVIDPKIFEDIYKNNIEFTRGKVIELYLKRLQSEPANADLHYSIGVMYAKNNQNDEAIKSYTQAISLKDDFKLALFNLGSAYRARGENAKALSYYRQSISTDPKFSGNNGMAFYQIGVTLGLMGKDKESEGYFIKAQQLGVDAR